jgi:hypothetical protein
MTRMEKLERRREIRHKIIYPSLFIILLFIVFLTIVDYRANSAMGNNTVSLVRIERNDDEIVTMKIFNDLTLKINMYYLKNDIEKLKNTIKIYVDTFEKDITEAIKQF